MNEEQNRFIYTYVRGNVEFVTPSLGLAYKRSEDGAVFEIPVIREQ